MRQVLIRGLSPVERTLQQVLPQDIPEAMVENSGTGAFQIHIVDLEYRRANKDKEGYKIDGCVNLIGLTFQPAESAVFDREMTNFDAKNICLFRMPFRLPRLVSVIERFPCDSVRLFKNPDMNLLWHLKDLAPSMHQNAVKERAIRRRIQGVYPELTGYLKSPGLLFEKLLCRVIVSLYTGLAHDQDKSLEGLVTALARAYFDRVSPQSFKNLTGSFLDTTQDIRKDLKVRESYFDHMIEAQASLNIGEAPLIRKFQRLHVSLNECLQKLEQIGSALLRGQGSPEQVSQATCSAAMALGSLLQASESLKRGIQR
jgi:hypothetical protein